MRSYGFYCKTFTISLIILLSSRSSFSQLPWDWGLKGVLRYSHLYSAGDNFLVTKVKYTSKNYISSCYTWVFYSPLPRLYNNQPEPADYNNPAALQSRVMLITRDSGGLHKPEISIAGSNTNFVKDFETDANDNYIMLCDNKGNAWSSTFPPVTSNRADSTQILLVKVTPANTIQWYKIYGGSSAEYAIAIKKTADGNFLLLAQTQSGDGDVTGYNGGKDIWLLKIGSLDGSIIWKKTIGTGVDEIPTDMEILNDGSIVISGTSQNSTLFPSAQTGFNSFLLRLDGSGNTQWAKVFGGNGDDMINAFVPITGGGFVSIGNSTSANGDYPVNNGGSDVCIFRHNATGDILWSKQYGFADNDIAGDIAFVSCDSMIYASWFRQFGGPVQPYAIYPPYSQNGSIRIGLKSNGTQSYYYQENITYTPSTSGPTELFNDFLTPSIVSNNRGGIVSTNLAHARWKSSDTSPPYVGNVTRTFSIYEYGVPLNLKNFDTSICRGQLAWGIRFNSDSTFNDTLRNACGIDTLISKYKVHVIDGDSSIVKDTTLCYGALYNGVPVYASFIKKDTVTVATICGPKLIITNTSVNVAPPIINPFGKDTTVCKDQVVQLAAFSPASSYLWQDGSTGAVYNATSPGLYWVEVKDTYGCKKRDSIRIANSDLYLITPAQVTIQLPQTTTLSPQTNGSVLWDYQPTLSCTVCQTTVANPTVTQVYTLSSRKDNCVLTASIKVIVSKNHYLYIPTAFTPNGDTKNDIYRVSTNLTGYFKMSLYNRYGQKVFETTDPGKGWDGNFKNVKQPSGTYVYIIRYDSNFTERQTEKGSFILIR